MRRIAPEKEIIYISIVIEKNIEAYKILNDRGLLAQNILSQLRNLVEDVAVLINNKENGENLDSHYENVNPSLAYLKTKAQYKDIIKFHDFLQSTASHYTPNDEDAERLILYFFRYMCILKNILKEKVSIDIIKNIDDFPIYEDDLTKKNYQSIAAIIDAVSLKTNKDFMRGRFYITKVRPFYYCGHIYYEITLTKATDYLNKFERITMFSKMFIPDNYSIKISYFEKSVNLISHQVKIKIIDNYTISIRPIELTNFLKIFGLNYKFTGNNNEYIHLMKLLTEREMTILDIVMENDEDYIKIMENIQYNAINNRLSDLIGKCRELIKKNLPGSNILRYFLYKLENRVLFSQIYDKKYNKIIDKENPMLSKLFLGYSSIPFDIMPYAMSLTDHNTSWSHLVRSIDASEREHEILARHIRYNCESDNVLYTSLKDVEKYGDVDILINKYNDILLKKKIDRTGKNRIILENDYLYINSYEKDTIEIIEELQNYLQCNTADYISLLNQMDVTCFDLTEDKEEILNRALRNEKIVLLHGPAGTGKTKMLEVYAELFKDYKKIFIANTNTAVDNLKARIQKIDCVNATFETVKQYIDKDVKLYDILFIDECSMVSNKDMRSILKKKNFDMVILVGDKCQIEAIKYGNWFSLAYDYFKNEIVYNLNINKRTTDNDLLELWQYVRDNNEKAITKITSKEYAHEIDESIFERKSDDEITLCLNYDGLYGINNINKIMQEKNKEKEYNIGVDTFKINDPIVFNDCPRFHPILYNNLKGVIKDIVIDEEKELTWFTIEVEDIIEEDDFSPFHVISCNLEDKKTLLKFFVLRFKDTDDAENDYQHIIPFHLAYALSIHKAQGLEYDSVKIVLTSNVEDNITKNIFYTAITRTKKDLKIYWSPESQNKIFENFKKRVNSKDISILKTKIKKIYNE